MNPSNTICVSQEGPANALALNKDCSQVVIAGRNVFKVFSIGENEFTEVCNLRVGKNLNLNFSSIDVAWSAIEENTLATAATNGAVVVWNLGRSGRSKQEHVFSDHKRTVNKVSFHLTEPALLISGSQDGMMKCFDLRMKEVARTFISNSESVRDVQFSPRWAQQFAAVSETGGVQVWDVRRAERPLAHFTAHSGPVFACDWHPDAPWLATASRDKTIKVWDMQAKPALEHTIYTIASVGHVKWRPQRKYQVSSCALVLDCAVHVWDVRRPHVPLATFAEHRDVTTAIAWQGEPGAFLSTSRDCVLYRHRWCEAAHPVLWANPQGVGVSCRGELAGAGGAHPLSPHALAQAAAAAASRPARASALSRKQPLPGSLPASAQATLERNFPLSSASSLVRWRLPASPLAACAAAYRLQGDHAATLAKHNAGVARTYHRHMTALVWEVVGVVFAAASGEPRAPPPPPPRRPPSPPPPPTSNHAPYLGAEECAEEGGDPWGEEGEGGGGGGAGGAGGGTGFHNSGVLGLPTHSIYIPGRLALQHGSEEGWVSAASAHYVDEDAADWTLPEEAFPLRAPPTAAPANQRPQLPAQDVHEACDIPAHDEKDDNSSGSASASPGGGSEASAAALTHEHSLNSEWCESVSPGVGAGGEVGAGAGVSGAAGAGREGPALAALLASALLAHAALGDVATPACVLIALQEHRSSLFPYIEESLQEQWLLGYIELLQRLQLYTLATEVIRMSWVGSVWALSQQSTAVSVACGACGRRGPQRCQHTDLCAVCNQVVRGLYAWCQGCAHGGHLHHMRAWTQQQRLCPAGCGHRCRL